MISNFQNILNRIYFIKVAIRVKFWSLFVKKMGKNVIIRDNFFIMSPRDVEIGDFTSIGDNAHIYASCAPIRIGKYVMIASNCSLVTGNHSYDQLEKPMILQSLYGGPITISDDVWIGANAVILPNVTIEKGAIIGANSVVTKNVKAYSIVVGAPARLLKYRFSQKKRIKALGINKK